MVLFILIMTGCEDIPQRDYDDFKKRTASLRPDELSTEDQKSKLADLRGMWLLRAQLNAGIELGLRVQIIADEWPEEIGEDDPPFQFEAKIWLDRQNPEVDDPIVIVDPPPQMNSEGRFTITANPLILDPETLDVTVAIEAIVDLESVSLNADQFCGLATGSVTKPFIIDLEGSTFNAFRDDDLSLTVEEITEPYCPRDMNSSEAGSEAGDTGGEAGDTGGEAGDTGGEAGGMAGEAGAVAGEVAGEESGPVRPTLPELARDESAPADLTGHWLVNVSLAGGLPLKLWASFVYTAPPVEGVTLGAEGGIIDGTLRRDSDTIDAEPIARFTSPINADGVFEVWLPDFVLDALVRVEGDLLMGGVILPANEERVETVWCGEAAGEARSPIMIDLAGTTLFAAPWRPGAPIPADMPSACP
jgi:hypothetical protein